MEREPFPGPSEFGSPERRASAEAVHRTEIDQATSRRERKFEHFPWSLATMMAVCTLGGLLLGWAVVKLLSQLGVLG